jgi:type II secretory pathway component PulJ
VISSSLMALILVSGYVCLEAALASRKEIEPRIDLIQNARVVLALMSADLRAACSLSKDFDFLGMQRTLGDAEADNLDFATHNYTPRRPGEADFCEVSFYVENDPETGQLSLWRRRNPRLAIDPLSGGSREELVKGISGLRLEYSDGLDWYDSWGDVEGRGKAQTSRRDRPNLDGLPEAVRITLWLDTNPQAKKPDAPETVTPEPPLMFQTVARLNLAASVRQAAMGSSSSSTDSGANGGMNQ